MKPALQSNCHGIVHDGGAVSLEALCGQCQRELYPFNQDVGSVAVYRGTSNIQSCSYNGSIPTGLQLSYIEADVYLAARRPVRRLYRRDQYAD